VYVPVEHNKHCTDPLSLVYDPAEQLLQSMAPLADIVPIGHNEQPPWVISLYEPAEQPVHTNEPTIVVVVPMGH
jgi:hypothetical protein